MMNSKISKLLTLIVASTLITACNEALKEPEPVDVEATEQINEKLLNSMQDISSKHLNQVEDTGKNALEQLSEADRQSLIDLTIDESAEAILEDAQKMEKMISPDEVQE